MAYALAAIVLIAIVSMARGFARAWRADEMAHLRAEKQQFKEARSLDRVVLNDGGNMNGDALEELDEQGDEIARLRDENCLLKDAIRRLADQDATLSVCDGNVTVSMDAMLTNAEREAIADAAGRYVEGITPKAQEYTATMRGLLERTK